MARTAQKAKSLAEEESGMADAMSTVLSTADEKGVVKWGDVSDDLTSGQWGRLIEKGILVDAGSGGFVVDDPEGVRNALEESSPAPADDDESGWSTYDKAAAVAAAGMFAGYSMSSVRDVIGGVLDVVLGPLNDALPFYITILVLAVFTGLNSTIIQSKLMDMEKMGEYQQQMQEIQEKRKAAKERGDDEALERIKDEQMDAMGDQLGMFKEQIRPMVWIMLINIPVFLWLYWMTIDGRVVSSGIVMVMPFFGEISSWTQRVGPTWTWLVWYFVASFSLSQLIRKALDIRTTPDTG